MRFWQKIFLLTLMILLFSLNTYSYAFVQNYFNTSLEKEKSLRKEEFRLVNISFRTNLEYILYLSEKEALSEEDIQNIFEEFQESHAGTNLTLKALEGETYADLNQASLSIRQKEESSMLTISSYLKVNDKVYQLSSNKDISDIYQSAQQQMNFSKSLSLIISLGTAVITLVMSFVLSYRINALRRSTQKMSHGIFFLRAKVNSNDEIGELAEDFNTMADTVESKVAELSQIADDRKRFIDNIAHEMKTPLTSIIGFADLLRTAKLDNKTRVEYADNIYREGKHLKNVSSKLMEIILLGKTNPTIQTVNAADFLDEIFQSMEQICINAGIKLTMNKYTNPYNLEIDIELMKSLLYNLIDNAVKASKPDSRILLSSGLQRSRVGPREFYFSVKDFGKGIPQDEITKITEPFYMLDKARTREHGGAGLGLALCVEIASLHNAELSINSTLGEGTEIKIIFHKEPRKS